MRTSFVEMLGSLNFPYMTMSTISFKPPDKILVGDVRDRILAS